MSRPLHTFKLSDYDGFEGLIARVDNVEELLEAVRQSSGPSLDDFVPTSPSTENEPTATITATARLTEVEKHATQGLATQGLGQNLTQQLTGEFRVKPITTTAATSSLPTGWHRFQIHEELGKGGCGVVARAFDRQLQREVVVKQILPQIRGRDDLQQRFWHEALITGGLEHPGIAPVYEAGRDDTTRQAFYAMKWLKGETLSDAIRRYHDTDNSSCAGKERQLRELLDRFVVVCQTLAYAHEKGVIHRDIKPANIMLGEFGETIVLDWGIAKRYTGTSELPDTTPLVDDQATCYPGMPQSKDAGPEKTESSGSFLTGDTQAELTSQGAILGTPSAMSPEQARGETETLDPRSDIFSLGSMLYQILTGQSAFRDQDTETSLARVRAANFVPCRTKNPHIPRPLAAICHHALKLDPNHRYQTASEMAEDIKRFLAGDRVNAYPEPWWGKADRWIRKHRTITWVVLISLTILTFCGYYAAATIHTAHAAEQHARINEAKAHAQTLEQLQLARDSGDAWLIGLSGDLQFYPGLQSLRADLLEKAREQYAQLAKTNAASDAHRIEKARAQIRLGDLQHLLGNSYEAEQAFQLALTTLDQAQPDSTDLLASKQLQQVNALLGLAMVSADTGKSIEAEQMLNQATALVNSLPTSSSADDIGNAKVRCDLIRARWLEKQNRRREAIEVLRTHRPLVHQLFNHHQDARHRHLLTTFLNDLARYQQAEGLLEDASRTCDDLVEVFTQLLGDASRPDWLEGRAAAQVHRGNCLMSLGRLAESSVCYQHAVDDYQSAWQRLYGDAYYSENLAIAFANLSQAKLGQGEAAVAEDSYRNAIDWLREAVQHEGASVERIERMTQCYLGLATVLSQRGAPEADQLLDQATTLVEHLASQTTNQRQYQEFKSRIAFLRTNQTWFGKDADAAQLIVQKRLQELSHLNSREVDPPTPQQQWLDLRLHVIAHYINQTQNSASTADTPKTISDISAVTLPLNEVLHRLAELTPQLPPLSRESCFRWRYLAQSLLDEQQQQHSRESQRLPLLDQWVNSLPDSPVAWYLLTREQLAQGNIRAARASLKRARSVELKPSLVGQLLAMHAANQIGPPHSADEDQLLFQRLAKSHGDHDWLLQWLKRSLLPNESSADDRAN